MSTYPLANAVRRAATGVNPASTSNTKWGPVRDLLAEALNENVDDVYCATVSYPRNLKVRLEQTDRRDAPVFAAMYTGESNGLEQLVRSAEKRSQGRRLILIFVEDASGWTLAVIVKQSAQPLPSVLSTAYPGVAVVNA